MTNTTTSYMLNRSLAELADEVDEFNESHGWKEVERSFGEDVALLHSEVSEALEAFRVWKTDDTTQSECKVCNRTDGMVVVPHLCKPEGVGSELADVLVRLLDTCNRHGIDLDFEFNRKMEYNRTRSHRHGGKNL
jgi:NTP pyrophosphatase (non-canonical NTP hydrolase)